MHNKDIVHLDLKPDNVLFSSSGQYKLGDLGLARLMNKLHGDVPEGDCRYLAKELLNSDPDCNIPDLRKADIFSLGMMAYELIEEIDLPKNGNEWTALRKGTFTFTFRAQ